MGADAALRGRLEALRARHGLPGVAAAVLEGGRLALAAAGLADLEHGAPATPATPFEIASVTKLFTAEAVLLEAAAGRLDLDAPLPELLPGLPHAWRAATPRHVLHHQSGLPSYTDEAAYWRRTTHGLDLEGVVDLVRGRPLLFAPGARHAYDNTGYYLLGRVLEHASGRPYGELLADRFFRPLGMEATRLNRYAEVVPGRARGYARGDDGATLNKPYYAEGNTFSAGGLLASARDLGRWLATLGGPDDPLPPVLREQAWTPRTSAEANERSFGAVGAGWFRVALAGRAWWGHNGSVVGFASALLLDPDAGLGGALLTNGDWLAAPHEALLEALGPLP